MNKALIILTALILIPFTAFAEEVEQTAMDKLIDQYELRKQVASVAPRDLESENRRLRNQIIDLRVEKDGSNETIAYLEAVIANHEASEEGVQSECHNVECIPLADAMQEKLVTYVIF